MQKVEILLDGPEAKKCADLINDLAIETTKHYNVFTVNIFCGHAAMKKGFGDLRVPGFFSGKGASQQAGGKAEKKEEQAYG